MLYFRLTVINFDFLWSKDCIISEILDNTEVPANPAADSSIAHVQERFTTGATFQINSAKPYVVIVALSIKDKIKFLQNIKKGFKSKVSWNKYRS